MESFKIEPCIRIRNKRLNKTYYIFKGDHIIVRYANFAKNIEYERSMKVLGLYENEEGRAYLNCKTEGWKRNRQMVVRPEFVKEIRINEGWYTEGAKHIRDGEG